MLKCQLVGKPKQTKEVCHPFPGNKPLVMIKTIQTASACGPFGLNKSAALASLTGLN